VKTKKPRRPRRRWFYRDPAEDGSIPPLHEPGLVGLRRSLFRGSVGSDYGKKLRWQAETRLQPHLRGQYFARNQLLSEGVEIFQGRSPDQTDILHEYFVPRAGLAAFVEDMRRIIPKHEGDLLNVTVRSIGTDEDTFLRYADRDVFSFVMLFNQPRTPEGDAAMEAMTQDLTDAVLAADGRYYLPYRLHATAGQFHRAYPQAARFFALKRKYDPQLDVQDHAEQPVPAEHQREQFGVLVAAAADDRPVGLHQPKTFDGRGDGGPSELPAVAVHADRPADRERVVRLHHRNRAAALVEIWNNLIPLGSGPDAEDVALFVQLHRVEREHVDHQPIRRERVPAHAVPGAGDRDGHVLLRRPPQ
jgi:hypothetical protein